MLTVSLTSLVPLKNDLKEIYGLKFVFGLEGQGSNSFTPNQL